MSKILSEVAQDAAELSALDRLKLARLMLELADTEAGCRDELQAEWDAEIETRLQELRSGRVVAVPLETVKKRIEARFRS